MNSYSNGRREFVRTGLIAASGLTAVQLFSGCSSEEDEGQKVSPPEDLMQEHGLLNRILLIYDTCKSHLVRKTSFPAAALSSAANIIRKFVEDYHEKQEENYLFPRFQQANQLTELVNVLLQQHQAGRKLTDQISPTHQITNSCRGRK